MTFQDLLQGVLSLGPGNRPPWQTSYLDTQQQRAPQGALAAPQQTPATPQQQTPLPLGPYAVHPGLQQALQPGQQVSQPGAGDALRSFQSGVLSPQLDPNQPQASQQPGNGVLALNNATAMAQANPMGPNQPGDQGPTPMALQSTDESTPQPLAKPSGALSAPAPATAKSDPVTRAKGILAAATSGDPGTFQAALTNPSAAAQVGSQTPDSAWNERSSYDGQAVSPTTPDGKPKPLSDQHAEDKQKTFGQRFMGALADPDTQDLLQSIGIGLLSNPNAMKGMAEGMQRYQQLHLRREDRNQKYQEFQAEQKTRQQAADAQTQSVQQTGVYQTGELASQKTDQDLRRQQYDITAKQQERAFGLDQARLAEDARYHNIEAGNSAATREIERQRLRIDQGKPIDSKLVTVMNEDGTPGSAMVYTMPGGTIQTTMLPKGFESSPAFFTPQAREDAKSEPKLAAAAMTAVKGLDDTSQVDNILATNPNGIGPSAKDSAYRWLATQLGLPGSEPLQELRQLKATGQIDQAIGMSGQRPTDTARGIIKDAVSNIDTMDAPLLKRVNDARKEMYLSDLDAANTFLKANPTRAGSSTWAGYVARKGSMDTKGGPRSGVDTSGNVPGNDLSADDLALINKHLK